MLDAVLLVGILSLVRLLVRDPEGRQHPWVLNAFVMAMLEGFVMVSLTAFGPLDLSDEGPYALDFWLALTVALTLWGIHRGPEGLRREWFGRLLAYLLLMWIPLGFWTAFETLNGPPEMALLLVGGAGVAGFVYGDSEGIRQLMGVAAVAFVLPVWWWAVDRGGALGAIAALVGTAALLFWVSSRTGGPEADALEDAL